MKLPPLQVIVDAHSKSNGSEIGQAQHKLFQQYGTESLLPLLIKAFPLLSRSEGRSAIIYWLPRYARTHQDVVTLAISALTDRSYIVREAACSILAYSLRPDVVQFLLPLLTYKDAKTRLSAKAAIDAITQKNHHLFVDRNHTGNSFWVLNPNDEPVF